VTNVVICIQFIHDIRSGEII